MPIHFPQQPALMARATALLAAEARRTAAGGREPAIITPRLEHGHGSFVVLADDLVNERQIRDVARLATWRCIASPSISRTVEVSTAENESGLLDSTGPYGVETLQALQILGQDVRVTATDYEFRFLNTGGLYVMAVWLAGAVATEDLFVVLAPGRRHVEVRRVMDTFEFHAVMWEVARGHMARQIQRLGASRVRVGPA